jgi:hypothetical protein
MIEAVAPGTATVTVNTDSNGKLVTTSFVVTVTMASIPGDVDMDGRVTIEDVTCLIDVLLGEPQAEYDPVAADLDHDGKVTIADATELIDLLLNGNN